MKNNSPFAKVNIVEFTKYEISRLSSFYNAYVTELLVLNTLQASEEEKSPLRKKIVDIGEEIEDLRADLQLLTGGDRY